jgi:rfaE bifunctional protein kinase chain/domain
VRSSQKDLFDLIEKIRGLHVLVVGDVILDRYVWGSVSRISPEAPVPIVETKRIEDRLGGAANAVRNLRQLGCQVDLVGLTGRDAEAEAVMALLKADAVNATGVVSDSSRPTSLKTRVVAQKQQVLRVDREDRTSLPPELQEKIAKQVEFHLTKAQAVILSDYGKGVVCPAVLELIEAHNQKGAFQLTKRPLVVDPHPANYSLYKSFTVAKPNRKEAELASGVSITSRESALTAAQVLLKKWRSEMIVITLGEDGLVIVGAQQSPVFIETIAQEVFDVSGAGDTVTALFTAALAVGASPVLAGDFANIAAGVVVSEVGTVAITEAKLRREIERQTVQKGAA